MLGGVIFPTLFIGSTTFRYTIIDNTIHIDIIHLRKTTLIHNTHIIRINTFSFHTGVNFFLSSKFLTHESKTVETPLGC